MNNNIRISPIIKLTEKCNYSCAFCRYANHRQNDDGMPVDMVLRIISQCVEYNGNNRVQKQRIIFHGGEPLLYKKSDLNKILEFVKVYHNSANFIITIQTNGSLIDDEWCSIFKENNIGIGLSFDGPTGLNSHIGSSEHESYHNLIRAKSLLEKYDIKYGILSVITSAHINKARELFNFYVQNRIRNVGLCYCYNPVDNMNVDPRELGEFLCEFYDLYFSSPIRLNVREFEDITRNILYKNPHNCVSNCRRNCGLFLTFLPNGDVAFCDDYDLNRTDVVGNIRYQSISDIVSSDLYNHFKKKAIDDYHKICGECEIKNVCKGGCPRNDQNNITNYFCDTYKIIYEYITKNISLFLKD